MLTELGWLAGWLLTWYRAAAIEKQKMVYLMNRDAGAKFTISSPLEAHKGNTIVFDCVGVDNGFDNPIFAFLEVDYSEADGDPTGQALEDTPKVCCSASAEQSGVVPVAPYKRHGSMACDRCRACVMCVCQMLTYYELDIGLNHVTRKWSEETDRNANGLIAGGR